MAFHALVVDDSDGTRSASVQECTTDQLPDGAVEVAVLYSSLNYKDGLAVTGKGQIIRAPLPFVPGIDLVGEVTASEVEAYNPGDMVIQTGYGLGENYWGGYAQQQRLQAKHLVPLPSGLTPQEAMVIGTAGFTAMLSVMALEHAGVTPGQGEVVVTGASGGVGSTAIALLASLGYTAVASTGSENARPYLMALGADRLIPRDDLGGGPNRPLDSARWAGAVDSVGADTLAAILSQTDRRGAVAACGLAGGPDLNTTVFPFILRGVTLAGIDSNTSPQDERRSAWQRLSTDLPHEALERMLYDVVSLADVPEASRTILSGGVRGRVVVDVQAG